MLQLARYAYREQVFDLSIKKVEKKGDDLYVYEGDYAPETILVPFPESLVEGNDKRGLLTLLTCEDAIANMQPFIERLLEGEIQPYEWLQLATAMAPHLRWPSRMLHSYRRSFHQTQEPPANHLLQWARRQTRHGL